uniref:dUTPase-like domain-containing protein n=1 Tax=Micrurus carvalhoi TaxID=3147026 RepID=A0A2H6MZI0_9SAUR
MIYLSSSPFIVSMNLSPAETVDMDIPGLTYFLPVVYPDSQCFPSAMPLLVYPHHDLVSRGVLASPFLTDSKNLSSIALICVVDAPLSVNQGDFVAVAILVPLETDPED